MKKILSVFLMSLVIFTLSACGGDVVAIEDYEWKMRTVASNDIEASQAPDELIIAVGEADELYPEAEIVDLTLNAKDGAITITDSTMLMCDKVAHKNLIDDSPLFRKTQDIITCPALCFCFQID